MIMQPQSRAGSAVVVAILAATAWILVATYDRDADKILHDFDVACHTPGETPVPRECADTFTDVPLCGVEDCSDQWPLAGYVIDTETGLMYFTVPDYPLRESPQKAG